ncbi:MAG: M28 family peptidase [Acidobacteria bacterium]|nr:MAG: M28 family peptidase [Acidobacteriota bacterium]
MMKPRRLIAVALLALAALPAAAERTAEPPPLLPEPVVAALARELSGSEARLTVQELSRHHRMRGSRAFRTAAEHVARRAADYGLSGVEILELVADGERFYGTQRSRPAWDADFAELWELRQDGDGGWTDARRIASWELRPITLAQDSASGSATADLVFVGAGTSAGDYQGLEVAGKLVLTSSQPGAVAALAVGERGAAGIVSYAQNQKSAWWGEDKSLVRWGHLETFAFMVSVNQADAWRQRLARGERVRLRAEVRAGRRPGVYAIPTAVLPGADPERRDEEIVFSCHLDHQRPGANDNASGCAAILEAGRALARLVRQGAIPPPRRTLRFVWPPEIEGTIALLNARPQLAARAKAVIHMDMVGGDATATKAIFHLTRSPKSLPTFCNDVAEAFGRFVDGQSYAHAAGVDVPYPLVDPEGGRQALLPRFADFSMGSDHQVWAEGSFRVPAIYFNDWPDRYIHTHADGVENIDPTKLLRAAFLGAASGYYLAQLDDGEVTPLLAVLRRHALGRAATALERAARLEAAEARNLLRHQLAYERGVIDSIAPFAGLGAADREYAGASLELLRQVLGVGGRPSPSAGDGGSDGRICRRQGEPKGPMSGFGYSYLDDRLERRGIERPALLTYRGLWGSGGEYAYEALNLVDGERTVSQVRDAVAAIYGPVPVELVAEYLDALAGIGVLSCE